MNASKPAETLLSPPAWVPVPRRLALRPAGRARRAPDWIHRPLPWLFPAAVLGLWALASARSWVAPQILPAPSLVLKTALGMLRSGELWANLRPSLTRVSLGFGCAAIIGVGAGALLGLSRAASAVVTPVFRAYAQIPVIAWVPLGILLLGIEEQLLVALIASAAVVPVILNTHKGVQGISPQLVEVARVFGHRGPRLLWVVAPAALPSVLAGLRFGLAQAWLTLVAAELIGTTEGMGYLIVEARELFQLDVVLAAIAVLGLTGVLLDRLFAVIEARLLAWRPRGF